MYYLFPWCSDLGDYMFRPFLIRPSSVRKFFFEETVQYTGLFIRVAACALRNEQAATLLEFMYHSRIVLSVGGSVWYTIRNLHCTVTIVSVLANSKTQNAFLFTVNAIFRQDYPLAVEPGSTPRSLVHKNLERFSTY